MSEDTTPQGGAGGGAAPPDPGATQVMPTVQPPTAGAPTGVQYGGPPGGGTPPPAPVPPAPRRFPTWLAALIGLALGVGLVAGGWALYQAGRGSALPDDTASVEATTTEVAEEVLPEDTDGGTVVIVEEDGEAPPDDVEPPPDDVEPPPDDVEPPPDDVEPPPTAAWHNVLRLRCTDDFASTGEVNLPAGRYRFIIEIEHPAGNSASAQWARVAPAPARSGGIWTTTHVTSTGFKSDPVDFVAGRYIFNLRQSGGPSAFLMRIQRWE